MVRAAGRVFPPNTVQSTACHAASCPGSAARPLLLRCTELLQLLMTKDGMLAGRSITAGPFVAARRCSATLLSRSRLGCLPSAATWWLPGRQREWLVLAPHRRIVFLGVRQRLVRVRRLLPAQGRRKLTAVSESILIRKDSMLLQWLYWRAHASAQLHSLRHPGMSLLSAPL